MALTITSPTDEATSIANDAVLIWSDSGSNATYQVYFGTDQTKVTNKHADVYRGIVSSPTYDPRITLTYGEKYHWLIVGVDDAEEIGETEFTIISETAAFPDAKKYKKRFCAASDNAFWYEDLTESPTNMIELSGLTLDTSKAIVMFEMEQKVYIVNDDKLKVVDFVNTKLTLDGSMTVPPRRGFTITQATSGAQMVVDYVAKGADTILYGRTISGTFLARIAITLAENVGGTSVKFTAAGHTYQNGNSVRITGTTDYNGNHTVTAIDGDTFTVVVTWVSNQSGYVGLTLSGDTMDPTTLVPSAVVEPTIPHYYDWGVYEDVTRADEFGSMPDRATIGVLYRGRACLTGNSVDPHQWYQSRQSNPYDWEYAADDAQSPVAGTDAEAGKVGDIITAEIPYSDDYMIYGTIGSLWLQRGDAAAGGSLDEISHEIGVVTQQAWCWDDQKNLYILDLKGLYKIHSGLTRFESLTNDRIPNFSKDLALNPNTQRIVLAFDPDKDGISIFVTDIETGANSNYFYDLQSGGFFPETYPTACAVMCAAYYDADDPNYRALKLGCYDGHIRELDNATKSDDTGSLASPASTAIDSYALLGPVMIGVDHANNGKLNEMTVVSAGGAAGGSIPDSDDIAYEVYVSDSAEEIIEKIDVTPTRTPFSSGAITAPGRHTRIRPKAKGVFMAVRLGNLTADETWGLERIVCQILPAGRVK